MKKILLATTTLIGVAGLYAGAALADGPKVTIGGYANFEAGVDADDENSKAYDDAVTAGTRNGQPSGGISSRPQAFRSDTEVDFKIDGKSDMGLGYGGEVDLLADTSTDVQGRGFNASKTFVYGDGNWGRLELGSNVGADGTMKVDAGTIARATGGIDGDWSYFANANAQYLAMSSLPLAYGSLYTAPAAGAIPGTSDAGANFLGNHTEENLDKVTYYTPRWAGFQLGVSYLPDETNRGQGTSTPVLPNYDGPDRSKNNPGESSNIVTGGLSYDNKFYGVGLAAAATGEWGKAENDAYENLAAWNAGLKLSWMGWSAAGSFGDWGKSDRLKASEITQNGTWYWDAGLAYEYGPYGISATYLYSKFACGDAVTGAGTAGAGSVTDFCLTATGTATTGTNKFQSVSVGTDYKLAPGLTPYAEVTYFDQNAQGFAYDNKGTVGIIGTQLNF